jgi:ATP phosphoribosyltransferase
VDDAELELRLLRAQEIGRYVDHGFLDCGITGRDWIVENGADVEVITDLRYSKATSWPTRWVLVVPNDSPVQSVKDLAGQTHRHRSGGDDQEIPREARCGSRGRI